MDKRQLEFEGFRPLILHRPKRKYSDIGALRGLTKQKAALQAFAPMAQRLSDDSEEVARASVVIQGSVARANPGG